MPRWTTAVAVLAVPALLPVPLLAQGPLTDPFPEVFDLGSLDGSQGTRFRGEGSSDRVGSSIAPAGDVNGDGIDDFIMGAPFDDTGVEVNRGAVYVIFGRDTATGDPFGGGQRLGLLDGTNGFQLLGERGVGGSRAGFAVAAAGDVNGDGIGDVIIGAPRREFGDDEAGRAYVVFGRDVAATGPFPASRTLGSLDGSDGVEIRATGANVEYDGLFGWAVAGVGDLNDDGFDDVAIGEPEFSVGGRGEDAEGSVHVVLGRPALGRLRNADQIFVGAGDERVGTSVAAAGDVNNDGVPDIVVGGADDRGFIVFDPSLLSIDPLRPNDLDGANGLRLVGPAGEQASTSVAGAGDVNGDGIDDVILGAPGDAAPGRAYVVLGRDPATTGGFPAEVTLADLDGTDGFRIDGIADGDDVGRQVHGVGDVNSDGVDDMIIGRANDGALVVFGLDASAGPLPASIALADLDGTNGFLLEEDLDTMESVAGDLDFNGDGVSDILLGDDDRARGGRPEAGIGYVVFGRQPAPPCRADLDGDGALTIFDFLQFQSLFATGDPAADFDGDGSLTIFDFLAFQSAFAVGCP